MKHLNALRTLVKIILATIFVKDFKIGNTNTLENKLKLII